MRWLYSLPDWAHDDHVGPGEPVNERTQLYHSVEEQTREPFRHYVSALIQALIFAEPCPDFEAETASALAQRLAQLLSLADVLGRQRALRDLDDGNRLYFAAQQARFTWAVDPPLLTDTPVFLRAPFEEGLTALLNRTPCLAGAQDEIVPTYEATADRVMRGLSEATRHQLRWMLGRSLAQETAFTCEEQVMEFLDQAGFMPRYATVVLRTALIRAHNAGRLRQAEKQGDRAAGLEFVAGCDASKPNHCAANGLIARLDDPVWALVTPPLGYNCRCTTRVLSPTEAAARRLLGPDGWLPDTQLPAGAYPDTLHFGLRPDGTVYPNGA